MERGFDPAAEFLLSMAWHNLFEATGRPLDFRCKGCRVEVKLGEREAHFNRHVGIRKRSETMRQKRVAEQRGQSLEKARAAKARARGGAA